MKTKTQISPGYTIPKVIVGCWQLAGGHGNIDEATAIANFHSFYQAGLNTFDCADIYTGVEELLGKFRTKFKSTFTAELPLQVHTKFVPDLDMLPRMKLQYVEDIIDRSLRRLNVEILDLVQYHWWDYSMNGYIETALFLKELQKKGKIKHLGVTNFDSQHLDEMISAGVTFVSNQIQYSVLDSRPEYQMIQTLQQSQMYAICYGTVAGGLLSDRYLGAKQPAEPYENRSLTKYMLIMQEYVKSWDKFQHLLKVLHEIALEHQSDIASIASAYVLSRKRVAAVVIGARNTRHIQSMSHLLQIELSDTDIERISQIIQTFSVPSDRSVYGLERNRDSVHAKIMRYNLNKE